MRPPAPLQKASVELCPCLGREHFGVEITCRTGEYRADKVPSDPLAVVVKYGKSTTKTIPSAFQFLENPIMLDHHPKGSFVWSVQSSSILSFLAQIKVFVMLLLFVLFGECYSHVLFCLTIGYHDTILLIIFFLETWEVCHNC